MPGKGARRRLRNQRIAREQASRMQNMQNHRNFAVHSGTIAKSKGGEERLSRSLRAIVAFTSRGEAGGESKTKGAGEPSPSQGTSAKGKVGALDKGSKPTASASGGSDKAAIKGDGAKRGKGKRKAPEADDIFARATKAKDGKVTLASGGVQKKKKKNYLQRRKEKKEAAKQRKKSMDDEDANLQYDQRRFFDEVAYEPPTLAIQKSKAFYSSEGKR